MKLWIESGGTKTEVIVVAGSDVLLHKVAEGMNPNYLSDDDMVLTLKKLMDDFPQYHQIESICYYGAGCLRAENQERVKVLLHDCFIGAKRVEVYSDLLAACHAMCRNRSAVVAVLGTGAAVCSYDGEKIEIVAPSIGYMLGDEGSGAYIGKVFITQYLLQKLSIELNREFEEEFQLNSVEVIQKVYRGDARQFFASLSPFIHKNLYRKEVKEMVTTAFSLFFEKQSVHFPDKKEWFFAGSVAFYYVSLLKEVAKSFQIDILEVEKAPLEALLHDENSENASKKND